MGVKRQGLKLTTQLHLVSRLRMGGTIAQCLLYVFKHGQRYAVPISDIVHCTSIHKDMQYLYRISCTVFTKICSTYIGYRALYSQRYAAPIPDIVHCIHKDMQHLYRISCTVFTKICSTYTGYRALYSQRYAVPISDIVHCIHKGTDSIQKGLFLKNYFLRCIKFRRRGS